MIGNCEQYSGEIYLNTTCFPWVAGWFEQRKTDSYFYDLNIETIDLDVHVENYETVFRYIKYISSFSIFNF